jgi:hypothetical protein
MSERLIEIKAVLDEYDRLESEGNRACETLKAQGRTYPPRPMETTIKGASQISSTGSGPTDYNAVLIGLAAYVNELKQLAGIATTAQVASKPAATGTVKATAPAAPSTATPKSATEQLLAAKGVTSVDQLSGKRTNAQAFRATGNL